MTGSCDLLKTRDPQPPDQENTANPPATTPQVLMSNLQLSFANKNVNDYEKLFSDTGSIGKQYAFIPTQKAAASYSTFFSHWTKDSEGNYFRKAMASVNADFTPQVLFTGPPVLTPFQSDSALYEANYSVFISPTTYTGHARFFLIPNKNAGTWVIYRWEDFPPGQDSLSWSDLKGQFSQ